MSSHINALVAEKYGRANLFIMRFCDHKEEDFRMSWIAPLATAPMIPVGIAVLVSGNSFFVAMFCLIVLAYIVCGAIMHREAILMGVQWKRQYLDVIAENAALRSRYDAAQTELYAKNLDTQIG